MREKEVEAARIVREKEAEVARIFAEKEAELKRKELELQMKTKPRQGASSRVDGFIRCNNSHHCSHFDCS